ncbi:arrestin-related trafficking adapter 3 [Fusarium sporotrichioides]|uniref:Arrestin-related trafficking adapter 3 n=1 Tax=Fusarium sporotrichioides TaxID=5514 RepID=A0A395R155_FUSSP|nr:arrestin-related trafficking adapter 3 [Fusarium sporotrichioides]
MLRGTLRLSCSKRTKIKSIRIKLQGHTSIKWVNDGGPDFHEENDVQIQTSTPFDAMENREKDDFGFQCRYWLQTSSHTYVIPSDPIYRTNILALSDPSHHKDIDDKGGLSINYSQTRHPSQDRPVAFANETERWKIFCPGIYEYDFEFPVTHHQLETIQVPHGTVKWKLFATMRRPGLFHPSFRRQKEVMIVRTPDQLSLEMVQPILFRRHCEDWLQYDITVSGKSFPIGGLIPIAIKLGAMDEAILQGFELLVNESIEYWFKDRKVNRKGPTHSVLLLKKTGGRAIFPLWTTSEQVSVREVKAEADTIHDTDETTLQQRGIKASGERISSSSGTETEDITANNSDGNSTARRYKAASKMYLGECRGKT